MGSLSSDVEWSVAKNRVFCETSCLSEGGTISHWHLVGQQCLVASRAPASALTPSLHARASVCAVDLETPRISLACRMERPRTGARTPSETTFSGRPSFALGDARPLELRARAARMWSWRGPAGVCRSMPSLRLINPTPRVCSSSINVTRWRRPRQPPHHDGIHLPPLGAPDQAVQGGASVLRPRDALVYVLLSGPAPRPDVQVKDGLFRGAIATTVYFARVLRTGLLCARAVEVPTDSECVTCGRTRFAGVIRIIAIEAPERVCQGRPLQDFGHGRT